MGFFQKIKCIFGRPIDVNFNNLIASAIINSSGLVQIWCNLTSIQLHAFSMDLFDILMQMFFLGWRWCGSISWAFSTIVNINNKIEKSHNSLDYFKFVWLQSLRIQFVLYGITLSLDDPWLATFNFMSIQSILLKTVPLFSFVEQAWIYHNGHYRGTMRSENL